MTETTVWPKAESTTAELIRRTAWSNTPLGSMEGWPVSLKALIEMLLGCSFPMVALWGPELVQIYNDGYAEIMGAKHPKGMGQPTAECWPEVWSFNKPIYDRALQGESLTLNNQLFPIIRQGFLENAYFTLCYSPLRDETTAVCGVLVTVFETTKAIRAEAALRESEARSRNLIEAYAQTTWETDANGVVVVDSPSWREYTGQTLEESLGYGWVDAIHPDDRQYAERHWREAAEAKRNVIAEFRLRHHASGPGAYRWTNVLATPLLDADGVIQKWIGMNIDIAERKQAESAVVESEQRFRALVDATSYVIYRMSPDWTEMKRLDGKGFLSDKVAADSDWLTEYILTEDQPVVLAAIKDAVRSKHLFQLEHRVRQADGSIGWTLSRAVPLLDNEGEIVEWFGAASDVTQRKIGEQVQQLAEERQAFLLKLNDALRSLSDATKVQETSAQMLGSQLQVDRALYAELDADGKTMTIASEWLKPGVPSVLARYSSGEFGALLAQPLREGESSVIEDALHDPRVSRELYARTWAVIQSRAAIARPLTNKKAEFVAAMVVLCVQPRVWAKEEVALVSEVGERTREAVERTRAEAALVESEERFRLFVENVREYALVQTDFEGTITSWNPGAERLFGYTSAEVVGRPFMTLLPERDRHAGITAREMATLSEGKRNTDAHSMQRKDGTLFWVEWITEPVFDDAGRLRGTAKIMRDETERQQADNALRASLAEKESLLSEIHHRVKNNLQVITSLLSLQARSLKDQEALTLFNETRNRVQSIASIHELLYQSSSFAEVDLVSYAQQLVPDLIRFYGAQARVEARIEGERATLSLERAVPFGLMLNELISNALKHGFPDEQKGFLELRLRREGDTLQVDIVDTGIGLPGDFRAGGQSSLGLRLIHILARQLKGEVTFSSEAGTHVAIRLPAHSGKDTHGSTGAETQPRFDR